MTDYQERGRRLYRRVEQLRDDNVVDDGVLEVVTATIAASIFAEDADFDRLFDEDVPDEELDALAIKALLALDPDIQDK